MPESSSKSRKSVDEDLRGRLGVSGARLNEAQSHKPKRRIVEALKTLMWVAPLTLLIWIYAEREQLDQRTISRVPIEVRSTSPDRIVTLVSPADGFLEMDLLGPRMTVEGLRDDLADPRSHPLVIDVPWSVPPGVHPINPLEQLKEDPAFITRGITLQRYRPSIEVRVMEKMRREVPVRVRPEDKIVGDVTFEPATVEVEGPAETLSRIPEEKLVFYADMSRFASLKPGAYSEPVRIEFAESGDHITYPSTVVATVNVRESRLHTLTVPVKVLLPAIEFERDRYRITTSATLPNVNVTGPPDMVQQIVEGKFIPSVVVELTPEDLAKAGSLPKRVGPADYRMPRDVTVTNPNRDIEITLQPRGG